jgi:hypothetical protein
MAGERRARQQDGNAGAGGFAPEAALRFIIDPISLARIDRLEGGWRVAAVNRRG